MIGSGIGLQFHGSFGPKLLKVVDNSSGVSQNIIIHVLPLGEEALLALFFCCSMGMCIPRLMSLACPG